MTTLRKRALRTMAVAALALHAAHCPSVNSGPDTGCVRTGKPGGVNDGAIETLGRLFPELPKESPVVVLRIDETEAGVVPTAQYIDKYEPGPTDPLAILPQLGIDECQCVRADGQVCASTNAATPGTPGTPVGCGQIRILGIDPHPPANGFETCIFDPDCNLDADGGAIPRTDEFRERCIDRKCTRPLILDYDPAQQRYVASGGTILASGPLERIDLTIELYPQMDSSAPRTCPTASIATAKLKTVTRTVITTPASGASVSRGQDLDVGWAGGGAGFVMAIVRGHGGGEDRTVLCRGLDFNEKVTVQAPQLARFDAGQVSLELLRLNAVPILAPPTQGGSILSVSTRSIPIVLQ